MESSIQFADDLKPAKTTDSRDGLHSRAGGVYPIRDISRPRTRSRERRHSVTADDKSVFEDEDPGLRSEGDYKTRQVKHTIRLQS